MFKALSYRFKYGSYLRNEQGIKKFAENALVDLLGSVTKRSRYYREMNETLLVEKTNRRVRATELGKQTMLEPSEYFSVRRRLTVNTIILGASIVASVLLTFFALTAYLDALSQALQWFVAGVFAIVLTGMGIVSAERLLETLIPRRRFKAETDTEPRQAVAFVWAVVLVFVELALLGLSSVRASMLAEQTGQSLLYLGFVGFAMAMPLVAGAIRWDAMRFADVFKTTQAYRENEDQLARIDSTLRQNEEFESNYYKVKLNDTWNEVNAFKTYKDNYNERKGIVEHLGGHFAQSFDLFQTESVKRYEADLRDMTARGIRRLETSDARAARTQTGKLNAAPMPAASDGAPQSSRNVYLAPKPVR